MTCHAASNIALIFITGGALSIRYPTPWDRNQGVTQGITVINRSLQVIFISYCWHWLIFIISLVTGQPDLAGWYFTFISLRRFFQYRLFLRRFHAWAWFSSSDWICRRQRGQVYYWMSISTESRIGHCFTGNIGQYRLYLSGLDASYGWNMNMRGFFRISSGPHSGMTPDYRHVSPIGHHCISWCHLSCICRLLMPSRRAWLFIADVIHY